MHAVVVKHTTNALQDRWHQQLIDHLIRFARPEDTHESFEAPHFLHHDTLRAAVRHAESRGRVTFMDWDCMLFGSWASTIDKIFDFNPKIACFAAEHVWRRFDCTRNTVIMPLCSAWPGTPVRHGKPSAWFVCLDFDRLRSHGVKPEDLDWSPAPNGGLKMLFENGRVTGNVGYDTGGGIASQLKDYGLETWIEPTHLDVNSFGLNLLNSRIYHHVYGRFMGEPDQLINVMHHLIPSGYITRMALEIMKTCD